MILIDKSSDDLLKKFETYQAPQINKAACVLQMTNHVNAQEAKQ
jgi:hypothetical protein